MTIKLICLDADDTLWDNMRHFEEAHRELFRLLEPFADAVSSRSRLEAVQRRNLELYGYGAKGYTLSAIETAIELAGDDLSVATIRAIVAAGRTLLSHPVDLLAGVGEALDALSARAPLVLVTKGDLLHQEAKIAASGVGDLFCDVHVVSDKTEATFRRIIDRHGVRPDEVVVAGDSVRSDILPSLAAGAYAALVPNDLAWALEHAAVPVESPRFRALTHLSDLVAWIDELDGRSADRLDQPHGGAVR